MATAYLGLYSYFRLEKDDPARRSRALQPMLALSLFSWSYLGAGLLLCTLLLDQYELLPGLTITEVLGGSLMASVVFSTVMSLIARRHEFSKILERMTSGPTPFARIAASFSALCTQMGIQRASLREATFGSAFSISLSGQQVVAISPRMATLLSSEETEAVLAHELSHIKNGDSVAKGAARLARLAFPFDPVLRLVEAAVHRERELWADRVAVEFTRRPLALASALVKANSGASSATAIHAAGLFVGGSGRGLLSLYPNLERRVNFLLKLASRMETIAAA